MARFVAVAVVLGLVACSPEEKPGMLAEADIEQLMIFNGSPINEDYHDATVSLHVDYGFWGVTDPFCSGTLIFDQWVMTAAHCLDGFRASDLLVKFGEDGTNLNSNLYEVDRVIVHNSYNANTITNDVGLIKLVGTPTFAEPIMPLPASIGLTSADEGDVVDLAGFGLQENGDSSELLHIVKTIADVRSKEIEYDQGNGGNNGGTGGVCNGDSGGPAFFERNGVIYLAGTTSYGDINCTDYAVSQKVDAFEAWIESNTGLAVEEVTGGGGGGPVTVTDSVSGTISFAGELQGWRYVTLTAGDHIGHLEGPAGTDFDLYLAQRVNNKWKIRGQATSASTIEDLIVSVPAAGEYAFGVVSYSGTGAYTLDITRPQ